MGRLLMLLGSRLNKCIMSELIGNGCNFSNVAFPIDFSLTNLTWGEKLLKKRQIFPTQCVKNRFFCLFPQNHTWDVFQVSETGKETLCLVGGVILSADI